MSVDTKTTRRRWIVVATAAVLCLLVGYKLWKWRVHVIVVNSGPVPLENVVLYLDSPAIASLGTIPPGGTAEHTISTLTTSGSGSVDVTWSVDGQRARFSSNAYLLEQDTGTVRLSIGADGYVQMIEALNGDEHPDDPRAPDWHSGSDDEDR